MLSEERALEPFCFLWRVGLAHRDTHHTSVRNWDRDKQSTDRNRKELPPYPFPYPISKWEGVNKLLTSHIKKMFCFSLRGCFIGANSLPPNKTLVHNIEVGWCMISQIPLKEAQIMPCLNPQRSEKGGRDLYYALLYLISYYRQDYLLVTLEYYYYGHVLWSVHLCQLADVDPTPLPSQAIYSYKINYCSDSGSYSTVI